MTTVNELAQKYYSSIDFKNLRDDTKKQYQYFLGVMLDTDIDDKLIAHMNYRDVSSKRAKLAYDIWCDRGISFANHIMSASRILFNYALRMEHVKVNPFSMVRRRATERRKTVWTKEHMRLFLNAAYGDFRTRNIGLIAVFIEQSKRKAEVHLPIEEDLLDMLTQQEQDFGFQPYVVPRPYPINGEYKPYTLQKLPKYARQVMDAAGLPKELRLSDLRRTGTTEMVEAGVGMAQIMSVTGHANPQSVKPYMKNTFTSANSALTARKIHGKSIASAAKESDIT
jgi:site-specific recombinase XerD